MPHTKHTAGADLSKSDQPAPTAATVSKRRRRRLCAANRARAQTRLTCLVTGFDPFGGARTNPTEQLVRSLPTVLLSPCHDSTAEPVRVDVVSEILPTASRAGWDKLKATIDATLAAARTPVIIVMTGLAGGSDRIQLERFALNVRDYSVPDNSGETASDQVIDLSQPDLIRTMSPLPELAAAVEQEGFPCRVSNHAGTFICNELYFKAMAYCRRDRRVAGIIFAHVPQLDKFASTAEIYGSMAVSRKALNVRGLPDKQVVLMRQALVSLIFALGRTSAV